MQTRGRAHRQRRGLRRSAGLAAHGVQVPRRGGSARRRRAIGRRAASRGSRHSGAAGVLRLRGAARAGLIGVERCDGVPASRRRRAPIVALAATIACDGILMSVGFAPADALLYQAGAQMRFDERSQQFVPDTLPAGVFAAGRVNGVYDLEQTAARRRARGARRRCSICGCRWPAPSRRASARRAVRAIPTRSSRTRTARTSSTSTKTCSSRTSPRGAGRLRQHRAAQALHHGRHGAVAGQALEHECGAHPGAAFAASRSARSARRRRGRSSIRCRWRISPGAASHPMRRTPLHCRHERAGAVFMQAGRLAAARVLRARRQEQERMLCARRCARCAAPSG